MPRLIPPIPDFITDSERTVWEHLRSQLPANATLIAGQRLTDGTDEVEIDLLVLWPGVGVAVIEVKGGAVTVRAGEWELSAQGTTRVLRPSPPDQAQTAKHTLLRWVNHRSSRPLGRIVHLVAVPFSTLPGGWSVPNAPRSIMLDSSDLPRLAGRITRALTLHGSDHHDPLDEAQADAVVKMLRGTHRAVENHRVLSQRIEAVGNDLTREQERMIALLRYQNRAQIVGGAGSGKTHLAMIKARHLTREGHRTALLCYSRGLARHFQLLAAQWPLNERPAYVGLFHDLPVHWGADDEQAHLLARGGDALSPQEQRETIAAFYEEHLPRALPEVAAAQPPEELFDAIVVDEAQDFADLWWDGLRVCLRDPDEGVLFVFTDAHQTVFDRTGSAPITLSPFPLDENLRSTATIARAFAPLAGAPQTPRLDEGSPVRFIACPTESAVSTADDCVDLLIEDGWEPGEIALLTTGRRHPEQRAAVELMGYDGYWDDFFANEDVFYGHVLNFKGLERSVVVLAVNGFQSPERAAHMLYVGLSRARSLLVVVGDPQEIARAAGAAAPEVLKGLGVDGA
ncbi:NERD domain-containing protein [Brachybacterium sp. EF45031]|uniref:nuclease-related domain-containing DEAD/DEAH box helicase n=1 Tax=Brachybacterium sillae TaxID=2810536 RepID=UPI00217DDAF0|nr:NERD domain-containing protein [Brachybacterium sillae]MCS6710809.1 NERD domain-containing protein [Brachybacterium sillae]